MESIQLIVIVVYIMYAITVSVVAIDYLENRFPNLHRNKIFMLGAIMGIFWPLGLTLLCVLHGFMGFYPRR